MSSKSVTMLAAGLVIGFAAALGAVAIAADEPKAAAGAQGQFQLPPGWTEADMKACMEAGTPGKMHELLVSGAGTWTGKTTMWMYPGADPIVSDAKSVVTPIMGGRFVTVEWSGEMPGGAPYHGLGIYGFDNVTQKFVSIWLDDHGTGIMRGVGERSADGKVVTFESTFNCAITKKPAVMRDVETSTGPDSKLLEMTMADPKSGKQFKMMSVELKRTAAAAPKAGG